MRKQGRIFGITILLFVIVLSGFEAATLPMSIQSTGRSADIGYLHSFNATGIAAYHPNGNNNLGVVVGMEMEKKYQATTEFYLLVHVFFYELHSGTLSGEGIAVSSVSINSTGLVEMGYSVHHNSSAITLSVDTEAVGNGSTSLHVDIVFTQSYDFLIYHIPERHFTASVSGNVTITQN